MNTRQLIQDYYNCWLSNNQQGARSFLADDLLFRGPNADFNSAEAFMESCWPHAERFNTMTMLHEVYAGNAAYIVYQGDDFCVGELIKFDGGKIKAVYVTFDPTR
ncbi:MAG: hypothetical protein Tsb002_30140 [Wenzhouxiangellaceae bacterium]